MSVTLKDISERVGKSVSTVSRALGGFDDIGLETRQEIQRVATEMGYEPNVAARNLQKKRTDTLALILPAHNQLQFSDPFFSELLSGIVPTAAHSGFTLNITTESIDDERETYLKHIRSRRVDGFIVVRTRLHDERIDILREHNMPFAAFGRVGENNDFHLVDEDGAYGIRLIVDHLVEMGHRRLACIAEPMNLTKAFHRVQGYLDGLDAHEILFDPDLLVESNFRQRSGYQSAKQLFSLPNPPTAVIACNDLLALGAISAAQEEGYTVGQDISITGFDDILVSEYANLTTLHQDGQELGSMLALMLMKLIKKEPIEEKQIITKPTLVIRQSTGPCVSKGCAGID